jgi:hypothetical protein
MKVFYFVAVIFIIVLIYLFSSLVPLPWFIYPPFILIFLVVFYWDNLRKYIPFTFPDIRKYLQLKLRSNSVDNKKRGKGSNRSKRGKRI